MLRILHHKLESLQSERLGDRGHIQGEVQAPFDFPPGGPNKQSTGHCCL
jgi:hypothetical protein